MPAETTFPFRAIVRGINADGVRVRRTKTIAAVDYASAWESFARCYRPLVKGLSDPSYSVLPPVGYRVDGSASRGYEIDMEEFDARR